MRGSQARHSSTRPGRVTGAGWVSIVMGVLAMLTAVGLAVMVLVNTWDLEVEPGTPVNQYRLLLMGLMAGGILVGLVPVLLGRSVLRGSLLGRYVLLALWIVCGAAAFFGVGLLEASVPVLLVMAASVAVTVMLSGRRAYEWFAVQHSDSSLLEAEVRMRTDGAGTRGVIALVAAVLGACVAVSLELFVSPEESFWVGIAFDPILLAWTFGVLWFALRALDRDGTRVWANVAVSLAIATPLGTSAVGLIDAVMLI